MSSLREMANAMVPGNGSIRALVAVDPTYQLAFPSQDTLVTLRSDAAPGIRGHGRLLDVFYTSLGGTLEKGFNLWVKKTGGTPAAVKAKLETIGKKVCPRKKGLRTLS